jgi:hypothetical protein
MVPTEPLWDVFTPAVITRLQSTRSPSEYLQSRLAILAAAANCGHSRQRSREIRESALAAATTRN